MMLSHVANLDSIYLSSMLLCDYGALMTGTTIESRTTIANFCVIHVLTVSHTFFSCFPNKLSR